MFKTNVGPVDRVVRVVVGLAVLSMLFVVSGPVRFVGLAGLIPLLTGAAGYCPLYAVLGLSTCQTKGTAAHAR